MRNVALSSILRVLQIRQTDLIKFDTLCLNLNFIKLTLSPQREWKFFKIKAG